MPAFLALPILYGGGVSAVAAIKSAAIGVGLPVFIGTTLYGVTRAYSTSAPGISPTGQLGIGGFGNRSSTVSVASPLPISTGGPVVRGVVLPTTTTGSPVVFAPPSPSVIQVENAATISLANQRALAGITTPAAPVPPIPGTAGIISQSTTPGTITAGSVPGVDVRKQPLPQSFTSQPRANLGAANFIGQIPYFLNAILSTPAGALPKGPLWVIVFDNFPEVIKQAKNYEPQMPEAWEIEQAFGTITSPRYQLEKGCILAQSVTIPGDSLITNVEGLQYNGYIRGRVGLGRQDFDTLTITFLNTNVSFVDNVVRPWAVMTGHLGMVARPPEKNYRTNITVYKLGIISRDQPPFIIQQFNFWGACAVKVASEELNYTPTGTSFVKSAEFAYQWYTTSSDSNPFAAGVPAIDNEVSVAKAINPSAPIEVRQAIPIS